MSVFVPLGAASTFAVLAGSGITVAGAVNSTFITGNVGTYPTPSETGFGNLVLNGVNHVGDSLTQTAKNDLVTAYNAAAGQVVTQTVPTALGGTTLGPGVYNSAAGTFSITGILTLDGQGNPNAVFIFQAASTLITASASNVMLINGAQACNCFWQVGSSATLGTGSNLLGTVLALTSITMDTSATATGRLLARNGAVTFDTNSLVICSLQATGGSVSAASNLISQYPCLACLSQTELIAVLVLTLATANGYNLPSDTNRLLNASKCLTCLTDKQMLQALAGLLAGSTLQGLTVTEMRARIKCLVCANPRQIKAALLTQLGQFVP